MNNCLRVFFALFLLALLAACTSVTPKVSDAKISPLPDSGIPPSATPQENTPQQAGEGAIVVPPVKPVMSGNRAVIALLERAQAEYSSGRREVAGTSLERALRIEPRNPWLWHELAQSRLAQGQYEPAISLARKSNSFAGNERGLQVLNWRLIGNARIALGDTNAAEQAFKLATELEQVIPPQGS